MGIEKISVPEKYQNYFCSTHFAKVLPFGKVE
jgi:hypothetical protein